MRLTMPEVKQIFPKEGMTKQFDSFVLNNSNRAVAEADILLGQKLWNFESLGMIGAEPIQVRVEEWNDLEADEILVLEDQDRKLLLRQGYRLEINEDEIVIICKKAEGFLNALSTLKQLLETQDGMFYLEQGSILDWPSIEFRSLSTTFAWYAGYGRFGFDMQLWGFKEWKEFLNICSDYKINQLNLCLYGYWPFEMPQYPEAVLRGLGMRLWNPESENWVEVEYKHPNLAEEFLPDLIAYGHSLGMKFFAYIGLNSYSGGYSNAHKEKRMKMPENGGFINDFDSLCLSDEHTIDYLKASMRAIVDQGFDGIDFEESEEAFWYCGCDRCRQSFWKGAKTPEETLHAANTMLLQVLCRELRDAKSDIVIGIRAWRQPPLVRGEELLEEMFQSIPEDVVLFWAPGQYVEDSEFEKWVSTFGRERIRARDTEAIGFAAGLGRLVRPFRFNGLRCEEEPITQYIEEDIRQHRGSVKMKVSGINGYQFEWYGFFMAFFAHAYYGWGAEREPEDFYHYALKAVFGDLEPEIYEVMTHMLTIHESQLNLFELEFPFAKNKVEERDRERLIKAMEEAPCLLKKLTYIMEQMEEDKRTAPFRLHFKKWMVSIQRSQIIYEMGIATLDYAKAESQEEKRSLLLKLYGLNEREFDVIKANYFDVNPVTETGIKSCMIPYHELKRILGNLLEPEHQDREPVYLGVESLGWMWF